MGSTLGGGLFGADPDYYVPDYSEYDQYGFRRHNKYASVYTPAQHAAAESGDLSQMPDLGGATLSGDYGGEAGPAAQPPKVNRSDVDLSGESGPASSPPPLTSPEKPQVDYSEYSKQFPATQKLNEFLEQEKQKPAPSLLRRIGGVLASRVPVIGGPLGQAVADPTGFQDQRTYGILKAQSDEELKNAQRFSQWTNAQANLEYKGVLADSRKQVNTVAQQKADEAIYKDAVDVPSLQEVQPPPQGPAPLTSPEAPPAPPGGGAVGQPTQAQYPRFTPTPQVTPDYFQLAPRPASIGGQPAGTVPVRYTPQGVANIKAKESEAVKRDAIEAAQASWQPLPPPVAQAFGIDPKMKVDPSHIPAYLTAFATIQRDQGKAPEVQVQERKKVLDAIAKSGYTVNPKDAASFLAQGKFTEYPPQINIQAQQAGDQSVIEDYVSQMKDNPDVYFDIKNVGLKTNVAKAWKAATGLPAPVKPGANQIGSEDVAQRTLDTLDRVNGMLQNPAALNVIGPLAGRKGAFEQWLGGSLSVAKTPQDQAIEQELRTELQYLKVQEARVLTQGRGSQMTAAIDKQSADPRMNINFLNGALKAVGDQARTVMVAGEQRRFGGKRLPNSRWGNQAAGGGGPQAGGMVNVQIPGQALGQIPAAQVDAFKKKYPNAQVLP